MDWRKCINWQVAAVLVGVAVALYLAAPGFATAALPLLVFALCPLSMLVMALAMRGGMRGTASHAHVQEHDCRAEESTIAGSLEAPERRQPVG